jgi:hypothetical protein
MDRIVPEKGREDGGAHSGAEMGEIPQEQEGWRERMGELIERHAEDYLHEGKRLLRTLRRTLVFVSLMVALVAAGVVVLLAFALLR